MHRAKGDRLVCASMLPVRQCYVWKFLLSPKTYLFEVFYMFVILFFFYITFTVPDDSYGHGGTAGDQFKLLLCNLDPPSFVSEKFVEITYASQPQIY